MKECSRCKEKKILEEFSPQARGLFGRQSRCKICNKELARIYREKNPTSGSIAAKKWREKYPEKVKEQNKKIWANPEKRSKRQNQFKNWVEKNHTCFDDDGSRRLRRCLGRGRSKAFA